MEKADNNKTNQGIFRWIFHSTKHYHGVLFLLSLLSIISAFIGLWNTLLIKELIDLAVAGSREHLIRTAWILGGVSIISVTLSLLSRLLTERTSYNILHHLQIRLFSILLNKDYSSITRFHSQEWMNRINSDSSTISDAICRMVPGIVGIVFHLVGAIYLIANSAPSFLLFIFIGCIALVALNYSIKNPLKQAQREVRKSTGLKNIYLSEHLSKLLIVKAFDREDVALSNAQGKYDDMEQRKLKRLRILLTKDGIQSGAATLASLAVLIYCAFRILKGEISYGTSMMLIRLISQIRAPLTNISSYISNIFDVSVAAERLMEAESLPNDHDLIVKSDEEIHSFYKNKFQSILFNHVGFTYQNDSESEMRPNVFEDVNLEITKKSLVAFTGMTGSGKSTLFKLLMSLYPLTLGSKNSRCIDGKEIPLDASFRRLFAYVPQGNQLMAGTIREMVSFGDKDASDEEILSVLKTACAYDFVEALPLGLDTPVGEKGKGLSEGQMQRLAIARALYTKRPILLLDEATSSLDEATERKLLDNLRALTDCTILIVTHRPAALSICDQEICVEGESVIVRSHNNNSF